MIYRWVRKNYDIQSAAVMKNHLNKSRSIMNNLNWIGENVCDRLCEHWRTEEFKKKVLTGKHKSGI